MGLKQNTWKLNQWYDQSVAGNTTYSGAGELWVMGYNNEYSLNGSMPSGARRSSPVQIPGTDWIGASFGGGGYTAYGMKKGGDIYSWGNDVNGSTGTNDSGAGNIPQTPEKILTSSTRVKGSVRGGDSAAMAVVDNALYTWGSNHYGGLGHNDGGYDTDRKSSPTQIPGSWSNNISCSRGTDVHMAGVKTDGSLWVWGGYNPGNRFGQLGQNGPVNTQYSSPVQIPGTWSTTEHTLSASAGLAMAAINTDGELWTWGKNPDEGILGQNSPANSHRSSPVQVPGTTWKTISMGDGGVIATKTDGTLWTWGNNHYGQLGHNEQGQHFTSAACSSPKQVGSATDWAYANTRSNGQSMLAIKTDGTLWTWGQNPSGSLGHNSLNPVRYSSPVQVPGTTWTTGEVGGYGTLVLKEI